MLVIRRLYVFGFIGIFSSLVNCIVETSSSPKSVNTPPRSSCGEFIGDKAGCLALGYCLFDAAKAPQCFEASQAGIDDLLGEKGQLLELKGKAQVLDVHIKNAQVSDLEMLNSILKEPFIPIESKILAVKKQVELLKKTSTRAQLKDIKKAKKPYKFDFNFGFYSNIYSESNSDSDGEALAREIVKIASALGVLKNPSKEKFDPSKRQLALEVPILKDALLSHDKLLNEIINATTKEEVDAIINQEKIKDIEDAKRLRKELIKNPQGLSEEEQKSYLATYFQDHLPKFESFNKRLSPSSLKTIFEDRMGQLKSYYDAVIEKASLSELRVLVQDPRLNQEQKAHIDKGFNLANLVLKELNTIPDNELTEDSWKKIPEITKLSSISKDIVEKSVAFYSESRLIKPVLPILTDIKGVDTKVKIDAVLAKIQAVKMGTNTQKKNYELLKNFIAPMELLKETLNKSPTDNNLKKQLKNQLKELKRQLGESEISKKACVKKLVNLEAFGAWYGVWLEAYHSLRSKLQAAYENYRENC